MEMTFHSEVFIAVWQTKGGYKNVLYRSGFYVPGILFVMTEQTGLFCSFDLIENLPGCKSGF
jgi:hypothetical protein